MGKRPILSAACYLLRLRVEGHNPTALERANIGPACFIQNQVPRHDTASPVLEDSCEIAGPGCPIGSIVRRIDKRPALSPIGTLGWKNVVDLAHPVDCARVTV